MQTLWKRRIRKWHRWLAIVIGIQIFLWMLSGLYFAVIPFNRVLGSDLIVDQEPQPLQVPPQLMSPADIVAKFPDRQIHKVILKNNVHGLAYELYENTSHPFAVLDPQTGEPFPQIPLEQIIAIAKASHSGTFGPNLNTITLTDDKPKEYFGPLPVVRVNMDDARATRIYVSPLTGEVLTRRNRYWQVFDFFWMLHIMDFDTGLDFNNNLLRVAAFGGLLVSISGYILWWVSRRRRRAQN